MDADPYADSMSVYLFPSGSHTLRPISISCAGQIIARLQQSHSLGTRCSIEDDRKGVIAGRDRLVAKWTQNSEKSLLVCPIFMLEMDHVCRRQTRTGVCRLGSRFGGSRGGVFAVGV
jgi:hypothetical protein